MYKSRSQNVGSRKHGRSRLLYTRVSFFHLLPFSRFDFSTYSPTRSHFRFPLPPKKPNQSPRSRLSTRFDPTTRSYTNNGLSNVPHPTHTRSREHPPAHSRTLTHAHKHTHTHSYTHSYTHHQPYLNYELGYMLERQLLYREATSTA